MSHPVQPTDSVKEIAEQLKQFVMWTPMRELLHHSCLWVIQQGELTAAQCLDIIAEVRQYDLNTRGRWLDVFYYTSLHRIVTANQYLHGQFMRLAEQSTNDYELLLRLPTNVTLNKSAREQIEAFLSHLGIAASIRGIQAAADGDPHTVTVSIYGDTTTTFDFTITAEGSMSAD